MSLLTRIPPPVLLLGGCLLIVVADFPWWMLQDHSHWARVALVPFVSAPVKPLDVAINVALGIPLGLAAGQMFSRAAASAVAFALPVAIIGELTQVYSHSRYPATSDVLCNVIGAAGAAIVVASRLRSTPNG